MPSALETLVKILKLEREQGCKNTAVIGGLAGFVANWQKDARAQARKPEHHILVDELRDLLTGYEALDSRDERAMQIGYMLDRIMGRTPPPDAYLQRLTQYQSAPATEEKPRVRVEMRQASKPSRLDAIAPEAEASKRERKRKRDKKRQPEAATLRIEPLENGAAREESYANIDDAIIGAPDVTPSELDIPVAPRLARPPRRQRPQLEPEAAADIMRGLHAPVTRVKGVGEKNAALLEKLGIHTINDLLYFLPRAYDDYTRLSYISRLQPNMLATVIGTVRGTAIRVSANGRRDFYMEIDDSTARLGVVCFGQHFLIRQIKQGQHLVVRGLTSFFGRRIQMTNPDMHIVDPDDLKTPGILPVYPLTEGLGMKQMRSLMRKIVSYWAEHIPDYIPESTLERVDLADLGWALEQVHFPEGDDHLMHARRRLVFDELLIMQLTIMANRRAWQSVPADVIDVSDDAVQAFLNAAFPFPLTGAQRRAIDDIRADLRQPIPMNRLLQGDVGSGKTAVAATALALAVIAGKQGAIMAPTGILAEQHYRGIGATLAKMPTELTNGKPPVVALLTGAMSAAEREAVYDGLASGAIDVVIGTHALIQAGVAFRDLAVAVIDEQHRFGVEQRGALRGKGTNPHLLVMTATPIPRTLALTIYADLDQSVIDEMPPGRLPVKTRVIEPNERHRIYEHIVEPELENGHQAFIVYPLVEASEHIEAEAAVENFERLKRVFSHHKVGLLHGRMRPAEKDAVMAAFRDHEFDVLVTTSVAEVGVDIPDATVIIIENATRFGLAQLHQFRGRVGRSGLQAFCFLVCDSPVEDARKRLRALEMTSDGFQLAQIDWQLRGAGDLIGTRQSGQSSSLDEQMNPELVELAQREARTLYEVDPDLTQPDQQLLGVRIRSLQDARSDVS